jgi:transcriptional regulator with XRE-family HTH domain
MADNGLRPIELSEKTGIPKSMVSYYMAGKSLPKADRVYSLAQVLGVSEAWLMGYDVAKNRTTEQKKNDQVVRLVAQLKKDPEFFDLVSDLADLPAEQYTSIKQLVSALRNK